MTPRQERANLSKGELNFLDSMVDLNPFYLRHSPDGKTAYNCDPCDGCGAAACTGDDGPLYETRE